MKLYIAMLEDRHTDVEVFTTVEAAIACAERWAVDNAQFPDWVDDETPDDWEPPSDWLFHRQYSSEGDYVRVVVRGLKTPQPTADWLDDPSWANLDVAEVEDEAES